LYLLSYIKFFKKNFLTKIKVLIISIFSFFCDLYSTNFPFPQFRTYPYVIKVSSFSQDEQLSILLKTYSEWKKII